jgi:hypothetical protein
MMSETLPDHRLFVLRIGDREREATLEQLAEHHVQGRLSVEELDRRQRLAVAAVTQADLLALVADLPPLEQPDRLPAAPSAGRPSATDRVRATTVARHAVGPAAVLGGATYLASSGPWGTDEGQFLTALAMGALGYLSHWVASRRR